jgi:hypothetical protein
MKYLFTIFLNVIFMTITFSQNVAINETGASGHPSSLLDVSSTNKGVLLPRLTTAQRNAIASPAQGLLIFNTDCNDLNYYDGSAWRSISLTIPGAINATSITSSSFTANWLPATFATTYRLDVSTSPTFATFVPGYNNLNVGNVYQQNVTGLSANTTYYYRVKAENACATSENSNVITTTTLAGCLANQVRTVGGPGAANTNSYETPFSTFWHDTRRQYIILASELTAAGFCAGNLTEIHLNVSSTGSPCMSGLTFKLKNTTSNTLTSFEAGTTTVYTVGSICPVVGWNTFTFSTPHFWDGTSNLLVEICFDNSSYSSNYGVFCETVPAGRAYGGYNDNVTGACSYTGWTNFITTSIRPVFRFTGTAI